MRFGVEIEFISPVDRHEIRNALVMHGIECRTGFYANPFNQKHRDWWKIITDLSVKNGLECVSPILCSTDELKIVCRELNKLGCKTSEQCGLHIHIGLDRIELEKIKIICLLWLDKEPHVENRLGNRKGRVNTFCKSILTEEKDVFYLMRLIKNCTDLKQLEEIMCPHDSWYKLNVRAVRKYGTIEFRCWQSTLDFNVIDDRINFCTSFIKRCTTNR